MISSKTSGSTALATSATPTSAGKAATAKDDAADHEAAQ